MTEFGDLRLGWLEAFVPVANGEKRTAVAEKMGIDQATVTKHIQKLEQWLGGRMLMDSNWPARLYPDGQKLLPVAQQILALAEEAYKLPERVEAPPPPRVDSKNLKAPSPNRTPKDG